MPRDGNGLYTLVGTPLIDGAVAEATGAPAALQPKLDDIADALSDSLAADGQTPWSGHQDASGFKLTGLAAATVPGDAVRYEQLTALDDAYQPLNDRLSAMAGLPPAAGEIFYWTGATTLATAPTTPFGRSLLALVDAADARSAIDVVIGANVQAWDADLDAIAALATTSFGRAFLSLANQADARSYIGAVIGTDVQAHDADLDAIAALTTTSFGRTFLALGTQGDARTHIGAVIGTNVQAFDPTLSALAAYNTNGLLTQTAADTFVGRSIGQGTGISVTNGNGISGNPTIAVDSSVVLTTGVQAISGNKTFTDVTGFSSGVILTSTFPFIDLRDTDSAADGKNIRALNNGALVVQFHSDDYSTFNNLVVFTRSGTTIGAATWGVTQHLSPNGSAAAPTYSFTSDTNSGLFAQGADAVGLSLGAAERVRWTTGQMLLVDGAVGTPAFSFLSDPDTGIYRSGTNQLDFATGGAFKWRIDAAGWLLSNSTLAIGVRVSDGSAAAPTLSFIDDTNSGLYSLGPNANNIGASVAGALRFDWDLERLLFAVNYDAVLNTGTAPTNEGSVGFRGAPVNLKNQDYTFVLSDAGKTVYHDETNARTWTIPANASVAFPIGTTIILDNTGNGGGAPGAISLTITTDTLRRGDGVAGTTTPRTIGANAVAVIRKTKTQEWVITGTFS